MLSAVLSLFVSGLFVGGLARWAIPGPDPMPIWLTVAIGLVGSVIAGGIARLAFGTLEDLSGTQQFVTVLLEIGCAALLIVLYRRIVQRRPITGEEAYRFPTRGVGIARMRERLARMGISPDQLGRPGRAGRAPVPGVPGPPSASSRQQRLDALDEIHDRGDIDDDEYLRRRREILSDF